uniref:Uncharacterized protein n=1 Tax=Rhizophora mucronata TaxID=61149 RepID=A0A2P2IYX7_RHIMU
MTRPTTDVMEAKPSWLPTQNKYKRRENQKEKAMERPDNKIPFLIHSFPRSKSCCLFELLDSHNQNLKIETSFFSVTFNISKFIGRQKLKQRNMQSNHSNSAVARVAIPRKSWQPDKY